MVTRFGCEDGDVLSMLSTPCRPLHRMISSVSKTNISPQPQFVENSKQPEMVSTTSVTFSQEQRTALEQSSYSNSQESITGLQSGRKRRATSPALSSRQETTGHVASLRHHSTTAVPSSQVSGSSANRKTHVGTITSASRADRAMDDNLDAEHVVVLSSIEQVMPRAYIRVCLTYRLAESQRGRALSRLNTFIQAAVEAKPYLSGYVVPKDGSTRSDPVEIRFSTRDYIEYPPIAVNELVNEDGSLMSYDKLDPIGFPPSKLHPEKVSMLPANLADQVKAPVFRAQANFLNGGIVVSLYLHHCISDGTGLGLLTTGRISEDEYTFKRHADGQEDDLHALGAKLAAFAKQQSELRNDLSDTRDCQSASRNLLFKRLGTNATLTQTNTPGRGSVISFPFDRIDELRNQLSSYMDGVVLSRHDTLQALIWRHMVRARSDVLADHPDIKVSKLLIPVNIRNRVAKKLPESYFGAAVDFAAAEFDIACLVQDDLPSLAEAAKIINDAISKVNDAYIRQTITLANDEDPTIDVRDLLASNMNRVTGADMYITSWDRLGLYDSDLGMGLGTPDWVRKPWSRDPGSCIILPRNKSKAQFEVVIQMTQNNMTALLKDQAFLRYVTRVID